MLLSEPGFVHYGGSILLPLLQDLMLLLTLVIIGWIVIGFIVPSLSPLSRLSLSFLVGAGTTSWSLFILGWIGMPYRGPWVLGWIILLLFVASWVQYRRHRLGISSRRSSGDFTYTGNLWVLRITGILFVFLFFYLAYISVGRSYSTPDALSMWAPKGYGMALEGSLWGAEDWGNHSLAYPLNIQLLIASFRIFSGDVLPGSKLIFPLFFLSYLLFTFDYLQRRGVHEIQALCITLLAATIPLLVLHATIGYANLAMAAFLIPGLLLIAEGIISNDARIQFLGSLLLGLTIWTIIEGVLYAGAGLAAILIALRFIRKGRIRWLQILTPVLFIGGAWILFYFLFAVEGSRATTAFDKMWLALRAGQFKFSDIRMIFGYARRNIFDLATWGYLFPAGIVISALSIRRLHPGKYPLNFSIALMIASTAALSLGLFYLRSFEIEGLYDLLERGFPRGFMTPAMLLVILMGALLSSRENSLGSTEQSRVNQLNKPLHGQS